LAKNIADRVDAGKRRRVKREAQQRREERGDCESKKK
jgi:hypothetical protein